MLTKGIIEDVIMRHLSGGSVVAAPSGKKVTEPGRKIFLSDRDLRRAIIPGSKKITVPANAIISPLSSDWLDYEGIEIVRT